MTANINNIHSTKMSLNDRFTAMASTKKSLLGKGSIRGGGAADDVATLENRNLLHTLIRRDKVRAALKLKRRSMRTVGGGGVGVFGSGRRYMTRANIRANHGIALARGSVKALRVAANGRPIKANSLSKVATMKADLVSVRNRNLRRSGSTSGIANRLGGRNRTIGGGTRRPLQRGDMNIAAAQRPLRANSALRHSRSRSRGRALRSLSLSRSQSRNRGGGGNNNATNMRRGRSRSRSQNRANNATANAPIQARLGSRSRSVNRNRNSVANGGRRIINRRQTSRARIFGGGVSQGRVQKHRYSSSATRGGRGSGGIGVAAVAGNIGGGRVGRARGRTLRSVSRGRSQSRNGSRRYITAQGQRNWIAARTYAGPAAGRRGRGRSQQRGGGRAQGNGGKNTANGDQKLEQRRGRTRSRSRVGGRFGRNQGKNPANPTLKKEDLDKELDQYMLTSKDENNVDYLLKH